MFTVAGDSVGCPRAYCTYVCTRIDFMGTLLTECTYGPFIRNLSTFPPSTQVQCFLGEDCALFSNLITSSNSRIAIPRTCIPGIVFF